jgi:peptidoglycan/LPS O-acetylase OafA/YrhL
MKSIKINLITKGDTLLIKAIGIILIVLHNYYRWVNPVTGENEFNMYKENAENCYHILLHRPSEIMNVFFNFLGHYGVQLFIFISAYGLTKINLSKPIVWRQFVRDRFFKLYPTMLLATLGILIFNIAGYESLPDKTLLTELGTQLSLLSTFIPGKALAGVGPWWFYSMIFQFYLIFPGLLWIYKKHNGKGLIIISLLAYILLISINPWLKDLDLNLMHTVFGHIPEFCFGIWLASRKEFRINILIYIFACIVLALGNYYKPFWYFSHLSALIVIIIPVQFVITRIKSVDFLNKILSFIGLISVYIFAIHGFIRWKFVELTNYSNSPLTGFIIGITFLIFSSGFAWVLYEIEKQIRSWIRIQKKEKI